MTCVDEARIQRQIDILKECDSTWRETGIVTGDNRIEDADWRTRKELLAEEQSKLDRYKQERHP